MHIMHIKLHICCIFFCIFCCIFSILAGMHILHILTYVAYYLHIYLHIIVYILHIHDKYAYANRLWWLEVSFTRPALFIPAIAWSPIPGLTYHHLQPSPLFSDLSQKAPSKSANSRRMAKCIVPVAPTGTRGRRPSMEDTGITYKTCACSRRS